MRHRALAGSMRSGENATLNSFLVNPDPFSSKGRSIFLVVPGATVDSITTNVEGFNLVDTEVTACNKIDKSGVRSDLSGVGTQIKTAWQSEIFSNVLAKMNLLLESLPQYMT